MRKFKRLFASFITFVVMLAATPIAAHAEWRSDKQGWWYA